MTVVTEVIVTFIGITVFITCITVISMCAIIANHHIDMNFQ